MCIFVQRIDALRLFKDGSVDFLLVTDLASRGLDIEKVKTVSYFFSYYQNILVVKNLRKSANLFAN